MAGSSGVAVYLEVGSKRVVAGALDWPGWCRVARTEEAALAALADYAARYAAAVRTAGGDLRPPSPADGMDVVERVRGDSTTDFGAPSMPLAGDDDPLDERELGRLARLLGACWATLDSAAAAARGVELRKGPRGGGRDLDAIVSHVFEAERAYLSILWAPLPKVRGAETAAETDRLRSAVLAALGARARGEPLPDMHRSAKVWSPRRFVRRSTWHALDHAWEIEDRAG